MTDGKKCIVCKITCALVLIGAINWGLVGAFNWNLVSTIFGEMSTVSRAIYILVGLSGVMTIVACVKGCKACKKCE